MKKRIITLITDFGGEAGYPGAVKGVILKINPSLQIVDISHQVRPFDVWDGAFILKNSYSFFPRETIHLVVVDPGVGSSRQSLLIISENFCFIGPDNGVFSFVYNEEKILKMINLNNSKYFIGKSSTFHARDIFAPVAAYLSLGIQPEEFGTDAKACMKLKIPSTIIKNSLIQGEILWSDRFGNLITNIDYALVKNIKSQKDFRLIIGKKVIKKISGSYSDGKEKETLALEGSSGYLEIAANQGSAEEILKKKRG
ncbi:MAG: SAM-dependent chlorinase/fluorinase, partial [Candidatus Zixiibacteriota bacterium]